MTIEATTASKLRSRPERDARPDGVTTTNGATASRKILVADDDASIRSLLVTLLSGENYEVSEAKSGNEVMRAVPEVRPNLVLLDLRMPDLDGIEILRRLQAQDEKVPVLMLTAYGTASSAIEAMKLGAWDYVTKPFELDDVLLRVQRVFEHQTLALEVRKLRDQLGGRELNERMIGNSPKMHQIYKTIGMIAQSDASVLITGETGAGKEVVADTIHAHSNYRSGPLVKVNLTALPETLVESELFGHEKGSFTGAVTQRKGRFEMAHKGTIFLDEIGDMTLTTQRKLLRVLQDKQFERVGGSTSVKVDCRIIAATNRNLKEEVDAGRFREDLYYRLNVVTIYVPPLRERKDDIPLLVEHFLVKYRYNPTSPPARIAEDAMQTLLGYDWPGNVRQLEHTIERAVIMARGGVITSQHLALDETEELSFIDLNQKLQYGEPLPEVLAEVERKMISRAIDRTSGNRHAAARLLGIDIASLEEKLSEHRGDGRLALEEMDGKR
ncbi:MAG: sigma-54-dependent Fis family transcriptional regulator [Chloroflexi bacterium]|nr:sigma-54-dependent Fis family transcriptional regulator [Chloroflexota bacterium]